jgi:hypothetical protein
MKAMSKHETNNKQQALPKPVALTLEQLQQIAAGTGGLLPPGVTPPSIHGGIRVSE